MSSALDYGRLNGLNVTQLSFRVRLIVKCGEDVQIHKYSAEIKFSPDDLPYPDILSARAYKLHRQIARVALQFLPSTVWRRSKGPYLLNKAITRAIIGSHKTQGEYISDLEIDTTVAADAVALVWSSETNIPEAPNADA